MKERPGKALVISVEPAPTTRGVVAQVSSIVAQVQGQSAITTLGTLLAERARQHPSMKVYRWLVNGNEEGASLTFAELDRRARVIADELLCRTAPGDRALLLYGPGLDFAEALFGCFYAGAIAVPAYVPSSRRDYPRIEMLMRNAGCSIALTTADSLNTVSAFTSEYGTKVTCLATDRIEKEPPEWIDHGAGSDEIAYLQYTSGSTSEPKGVMVTHRNVLANLQAIAAHGAFGENAVSVSWLPHFHDMGLIYGILQPIYSCFPAILLSPSAFIHRPLRWLSAISRYRGTHCGGPNFAYDLCVERIGAGEASSLDLSSWQIAFSGAEPVHHETLERFAGRFAGCGFSSKAFYPVYGLAEASLKATSGEPGAGPKLCIVDAEKLAENKIDLADEGSLGVRRLVSCGRASVDHEIAISDPDSGALCAQGQVGEIWFSGPSVAAGYWNNPAITEKTFRAYLSNGKGPYLRTGDLGFLHAGDLFITGRLKDCVILRGRNHYPQDIERTVEDSHPAVRRNGCAVFSVPNAGQEAIVVVAEVDRRSQSNLDSVLETVRCSVAETHEIPPYAVVLINAGSLPKTSSGKVQRRTCRQRFLDGDLSILAQSIFQNWQWEDPETHMDREAVLATDHGDRRAYVEGYVRRLLTHGLRHMVDQSAAGQSLVSLGVDSLTGFNLLAKIEADLGVTVPVSGLLNDDIAGIASRILDGIEARERDTRRPLSRLPRPVLAPLAPSQQQVWFLQQLYPESCAYNEHLVVGLQGNVAMEALRRAINEIGRRHEILRTAFISVEGVPHQSIQPFQPLDLPIIQVAEGGESLQDIQTVVAREVQRPFQLDRDLPIRFLLLKAGAHQCFLLLVAHHIVCDGSSLSIVLHELGTLYEAYTRGRESPLPELEIQYADYSVWQREYLQGELLERDLDYWRRQLAGMQVLDLPADHLRPALPDHRGHAIEVDLPASLQQNLKEFGRREGVTLFISLLTAFQVMLSKYTGQLDVTVGTAIANRRQEEIRNLIGFFVNTLVLRTQLDGNPTFRDMLVRTRKVALDAYEHQHVPFERLVEELLPERDLSRSPLFQAMLVVQPQLSDAMEYGAVKFTFPEIDAGISKFDLTLRVVDGGGGLRASIEYAQAIFDPSTIRRMADHLRAVLERMVAEPQQRIGDLSLLTTAEQEQMLVEWNETETEYPQLCVHELFARQAAMTPDAVAVECQGRRLSYGELNGRANQLAHYLQRIGVGPETRVGICLERNLEMVIGLLAVLKAGGAYLPLDPAYPRERLQFMVEDGQASVLLTQERFRELLPPAHAVRKIFVGEKWAEISAEAGTDVGLNIHPGNLAYVIYTSGSTGQPKGVAIVHQGASVLVQWAREAFGPEELRGVLASTSICFDLSVFEIFVPLSVGGCVIVASDALALPQWLDDNKITLVNTVPSAMTELVRMKGIPSSVRVVNLAGEALQRSLVEQTYDVARFAAVVNLYGPSEDTTYSTYVRLKKGQGMLPVGIGRPIANTQAYVLDAHGQPLPVGVAGELHLGGAGLARGYLNRPALTAEKFVPNPFSQKPGERLYRTGDRARWQVDGNLEFLGRLDHQIKLRGFRIELGEIEAALLEHEMVEQAVAVVREDQRGEKQLVAYVVCAAQKESRNPPPLREYLRGRLPEYMVPAVIVEMQEFPLTPNGKVNRKALPEPELQGVEGRNQAAPEYPEEEILCGIFADVLKLESVGVDCDFFDLGGHSLLATQVISRVRNAFGVELPLRAIFETRTARSLAEQVRGARIAGRMPSLPLLPAARTEYMPLSYAQQRMWFLDQLNPGSTMYNMPFEMRLSGQLDEDALQRSLNRIAERHEVLRTSFVIRDGSPWQRIAGAQQQLKVEKIDLRTLPQEHREAAALELARTEAARPFDLARGPLLRVKLLHLEDQEYLLLLNMHHILSDGWSVGVMVREFSSLYAGHVEGHEPVLPKLAIQYADYAVWQREWFADQVFERQLGYWKKQLAEVPALELPAKKLASPEMSNQAENERVRIPPGLTEELKGMSRREGVTLFMSLLAAFSVALSDFSGQKDVAIGTPIANRERAEIEGLIGLFLNTLVLRNDLTGSPSFRTLLRRTREMVLDAHAHQDIPFEKLVEELAPGRDSGKTPFFQVMVSMQNTEHEELHLPRLRLSGFASRTSMAKFDLLLLLSESGGLIEADLFYRCGLYEAPTMQGLMRHWIVVLETMVAEIDMGIGEVPLLSDAECRQLLVEWNPPATPYPPSCIHDLFEEQVKRTPDAAAVKHENTELTYAELDRRANQIGHYLKRLGVEPEIRVGICMERGLEMVTGLLGILKAGGAYVPLDPGYPLDRLHMMMEDAQAPVLLTQSSLMDRLRSSHSFAVCVDEQWGEIAAESSHPVQANTREENLAYVIYTSGSTGKPKGVAIPHRSAAALLHWGREVFSAVELAGVLASTSICFDLSVFEIFQPLTSGGKVIVTSNALGLAQFAGSDEITLVNTVPSAMHELVRMEAIPESVKVVNLAGEVLQGSLVQQIYKLKNVECVVNLYGPSEDTTYSTYLALKRDECEHVTIGKPIANTQAYVLDQDLRAVSVGVVGELWLGGEGLARGYLRRPEMTAERFLPNPFSKRGGARLYRTGDRARWQADGNLEFLGRLDHQVKLRGYRIELGEIEAALLNHESVEQAVVVVRGSGQSDKRLVAYLVPREHREPVSVDELRTYLRGKLPEYMTPGAFVVLDELPLTPNGKLDRKALPEPERGGKEYVAPSTPVEEALAAIWSEVLKMKRPGIRDNFFEMGGHSLLAVQLASRVREVLQVNMPLRQLFERPTIETMSEYISNLPLLGDGSPELVPVSREAYRI